MRAARGLHEDCAPGRTMERGLDLSVSLDSLEECDTDSLCEERRYQTELKKRIYSDGEASADGDARAGIGEMVETPHLERTATHRSKGSKEVQASYSELRYDPNWRRHRDVPYRSPLDDEVWSDASSSYSDNLSPDGSLQDSPAEWGHDINAYHMPTSHTMPNRNPSKPMAGNPVLVQGQVQRGHQNVVVTDQGTKEVTRKDFVKKNKATLGVRALRTHSYLHMHKEKTEESSSDQDSGKSEVQQSKSTSTLVSEMRHNKPEMLGTAVDTEIPSIHIHPAHQKNIDIMACLSSNTDTSWSGQPVYPSRQADNGFPASPPYSAEATEDINLTQAEPWTENTQVRPQRLQPNWIINESTQEIPVPSSLTNNPHHYIVMSMAPDGQSAGPNRDPHEAPNTPIAETGDQRLRHTGESQQRVAKNRQMEEKHQKMLVGYLKQEVKLGGIGPTYTISQEKKKQLRQQKEYAKLIQERNRNIPIKARDIPVVQVDKDKGKRQKSLEYAKKVPRPQPPPKTSVEPRSEEKDRRASSYDALFPQIQLLQDLQVRHEREKMAVAALRALHIK